MPKKAKYQRLMPSKCPLCGKMVINFKCSGCGVMFSIDRIKKKKKRIKTDLDGLGKYRRSKEWDKTPPIV